MGTATATTDSGPVVYRDNLRPIHIPMVLPLTRVARAVAAALQLSLSLNPHPPRRMRLAPVRAADPPTRVPTPPIHLDRRVPIRSPTIAPPRPRRLLPRLLYTVHRDRSRRRPHRRLHHTLTTLLTPPRHVQHVPPPSPKVLPILPRPRPSHPRHPVPRPRMQVHTQTGAYRRTTLTSPPYSRTLLLVSAGRVPSKAGDSRVDCDVRSHWVQHRHCTKRMKPVQVPRQTAANHPVPPTPTMPRAPSRRGPLGPPSAEAAPRQETRSRKNRVRHPCSIHASMRPQTTSHSLPPCPRHPSSSARLAPSGSLHGGIRSLASRHCSKIKRTKKRKRMTMQNRAAPRARSPRRKKMPKAVSLSLLSRTRLRSSTGGVGQAVIGRTQA